MSGGLGRLKVKNDGDRDAYLVLAKSSAPKKALLGVYVRAAGRRRCEASWTAPTSCSSARGALGRALAPVHRGAERRRFEDPIKFKTTRTSYTIWTLSLESVLGGNAPTNPVDEGEFPG